MKHIVFSGVFLLVAAVAGEAMAACFGIGTQIVNVGPLLNGRMACKSQSGNWIWQEWHGPGGGLFDYKMGTGHPTDATEGVGSWSTAGLVVRYNYSGVNYDYTVWQTGPNQYSFCTTGGGSDVLGVTLLTQTASPVSCGTP